MSAGRLEERAAVMRRDLHEAADALASNPSSVALRLLAERACAYEPLRRLCSGGRSPLQELDEALVELAAPSSRWRVLLVARSAALLFAATAQQVAQVQSKAALGLLHEATLLRSHALALVDERPVAEQASTTEIVECIHRCLGKLRDLMRQDGGSCEPVPVTIRASIAPRVRATANRRMPC